MDYQIVGAEEGAAREGSGVKDVELLTAQQYSEAKLHSCTFGGAPLGASKVLGLRKNKITFTP